MPSPINQMMIIASQIKEATQRGENTANRVGGLLVDIVDYLSILRVDEVELGPFLTALKNSQLLDPHDGQTLTFSILEDKWTFSSAITQLKLSQKGIEEAVASNYQVLQQTKELLQGELDQVEADLNGKYDNLTTWRVQTDAYIAQYATAYDENGNLVAMSKIMQTADEVKSEVEALETRVTNIADPEFWEQGTTSNEEAGHSYDSSKEDNTKVIRTVGPFAVTLDAYLTFTPENNPFSVSVLYFNTYKEFCDSATGWSKGWCKLDEQENGKVKLIDSTSNDTQYIAIKIKKNDDTDITIDDVKEVGLNLVTSNITSHSELKQTADAIIARVEDDENNIAQLSIKADKIESNVKAQSGSNRIPKANTFTGDAKTSEIFYLPKGQYVFQVRNVYNGAKLRGQTEAERDKSSATFSGTTAVVPNGTFSDNTLVLEEDPSMYYDIFTMTSPQTIELGIYSAYYQVFTLNANYYCQVVLPAGSLYPQIEPGDTPTTFNMGGVTSESYIVQTAFEISSSVADGITEEAVSTLQNKLEPDVFKDAVNGYATFRTQTDAFIGSIAGQFNPDGTLKYYSTTEQTAQYIKMEVAEMESRITNLADPGIWEQGTTSGESAGRKYEDTKSYSSKVVRTEYVIPTSEDAYITFTPENNNYAIQVLYFNKNKVYCSSSTHWKIEWTALNEVNEGKVKIINQSDVQYVAVKLRKGDGSTDITVDDVKKAGISLTTSNIATSSEVKITATEISQTVSDGIAKEYMNNLKSLIHPDSLPNDHGEYVYATWKGQTSDAIRQIAGKWDSEGNLIGYSTTEQTWDHISSEVADGVALSKGYTNDLKAMINTDVLKDESGNYAYATFKQQTNSSISSIAGKWDDEGNLIGYSTTTQTADMISSAVSDAEKYTDQLKDIINTDVLKDASGNYAYATFKKQTNESISTIAGKWDEEGNLIGYSTTTQTATMIKTTVEGYGYITAEDLPDMTKYYTKTQIDQTVDTINLSVKAAKDEADAIAEDYVTSADISLFITADEAGTLISNANIKADKIKFDVTFDWTVKNRNNETIFNLDSNGNLTIAGEFNGGTITDGIEISGSDSQINKMKIVPAGVNGAALIGISNNNEVINLSFDNSNAARMIIKDSSSNIKITSSKVEMATTTASGTMFTEIGNSGSTSYARFVANNKDLSIGVANDGTINIGGVIWPSSTNVAIGYIYKDNNGYLRVK